MNDSHGPSYAALGAPTDPDRAPAPIGLRVVGESATAGGFEPARQGAEVLLVFPEGPGSTAARLTTTNGTEDLPLGKAAGKAVQVTLEPGRVPAVSATLTVRYRRAPWYEPPSQALLAPNGKRLFLISATGFDEDTWFDGPLAHVLADGSVASYLPSGGGHGLYVPLELSPEASGASVETALGLEGSAAERGCRCLTSAFSTIGVPDDKPLVVTSSLRGTQDAVALVLFAKAHPDVPLVFWPKVALSEVDRGPQWKRLTENLGLEISFETQNKAGSTSTALDLDGLADMPWGGTVESADLASVLNSPSEIIPAKLARP